MKAPRSMDLGSNLDLDRPQAPPRIWLVLDENDAIPPTGLYIGLNGVGYLLKPGVEAHVPIGVQNILDDAVEAAPIVDQASRKVTGWRKKRRFSYRQIARPEFGAAG